MARTDKHRPQEASSRAPCSVARPLPALAVQPTRKVLDPRFDRSMGHYNPDLFQKSFAFLSDFQSRELAAVRQELAGSSASPQRRQELQRLLDRVKSKEMQQRRDERRKALVKEWRTTEEELVASGRKRPFHLKKADVKKLELIDQYRTIKQKNPDVDVDKLVEKKRMRKASKQHRDMPAKWK